MYLTCSLKKQFAPEEKKIVKSENGVNEMKKNKDTAEQIVFVLKQAEPGMPTSEVCRKLGIAEQTFYRW